MTAEGIRLTPNPFACLDAECAMEEDRGPDTPTYLDGPARKRLAEVSFRQLEEFFKLAPLPRDNELKEKFDMGSNLLLGDPIPLGGQDVPEYETRAPAGFVGWNALFSHLISLRDQVIVCDTVYILVDNRDLSDLRNAQGIVPHLEVRVGYYLLTRHGEHRYVRYVALTCLLTYTCRSYNCCKCALYW